MKTNKETYYDANEDAAAWEMSQHGHRIVYDRKGRSRNVYGITTLGPLVSCDDCDRSFSSKTGPDYLPEIVHAVIGDVRRGRLRFCKDCIRYEPNRGISSMDECTVPFLDLVTGKSCGRNATCHNHRAPGGACGPEGLFWEATNKDGEKLE